MGSCNLVEKMEVNLSYDKKKKNKENEVALNYE
jgi:hypothetical protein